MQVARRRSRPDSRLSAWGAVSSVPSRDTVGFMGSDLAGFAEGTVVGPALSFEVRIRSDRRSSGTVATCVGMDAGTRNDVRMMGWRQPPPSQPAPNPSVTNACSKARQGRMRWPRSGTLRPPSRRIEHGGDRVGGAGCVRCQVTPAGIVLPPEMVGKPNSQFVPSSRTGNNANKAVTAIHCMSGADTGRDLYTSGSTVQIWRRQSWEHL